MKMEPSALEAHPWTIHSAMKMQLQLLLFIFNLLLTGLTSVETTRLKQPIFVHRVDCIGQPYPYAQYVRCGIRTQRNQSQQLIGELVLDEPVQSLIGSFNIYTKHQFTQTHIYGTEMDLCQYLDQERLDRIMGRNIVAEIVLGKMNHIFPHLMHPCPYEGLVNMTGTEVRLDLVPPYILPGKYIIEAQLYDKVNRSIVRVRVVFSLNGKGMFEQQDH